MPYFGYVNKKDIDFKQIDTESMTRLSELVELGMVTESSKAYHLSSDMYAWNHVVAYYLTPKSDREVIESIIKNFDSKFYVFDKEVINNEK